jgi:type IV pilus assembly protein PilY1
MVLALSLVAGLSAPFVMLPPVKAAVIVPDGTTELSAAPVEQTKAVPPNIVVTFDDSGSMAWDYLGDHRPFDNGSWSGPWRCAGIIDASAASGIGTHVMNGVYYNPDPAVNYLPPVYANGNSFPAADATLRAVQNDGVTANRPMSPSGAGNTTNFTGTLTQATGWYWNGTGSYTDWNQWVWGTFPTGSGYYSNNSHSNPPDRTREVQQGPYPTNDNRWTCPSDRTSPIASGGPYYYRYTGPAIDVDAYGNPTSTGLSNLYTASNWTAVAVPAGEYQRWANWWSYYHTRNQMARTALSRVFGSSSLAARTDTGGFGSDIRVAWQNINASTYKLPSSAIISALVDTANCTSGSSASPSATQQWGASTTPPDCYRSAFFNWIFQVPASGGTPLRSAFKRAGEFFKRGAPTATGNGTLEDPYWQPPQNGAYDATTNAGNELYCRQNFSLVLTDGLWNTNYDGGTVSSLTQQPTVGSSLPDGVVFPDPGTPGVTSIYSPQHDADNPGYVSLSDLAYNYWATNLRPDLYDPAHLPSPEIVTPYLPDTYTGLFTAGNVTLPFPVGTNSDGTPNYDLPAEEYFNPQNDPASWPHMAAFMVGLGVNGLLNFSDNTDCQSATAVDKDACDLRKGTANSLGSVGWPQPRANGTSGVTQNIDDTWHAALAGRGQFFSAGNPQQLVDQLTSVLASIAARAANPVPAAVNASVATVGALSYRVGHNADWSGVFQAVVLNSDGTINPTPVWDAGTDLDTRAASDRKIFTATYNTPSDCGAGTYTFDAGTTFDSSTAFDCVETAGLSTPALAGPNDLPNRVAYLRGDRSHEGDQTYRARTHLLGAIIHSQPVYVASPSGNYFAFPSGSPEATAAAASNGTDDKSYDSFIADHGTRKPAVYVGANDGMLHAFSAPTPTCTFSGGASTCNYDPTGDAGKELWAFVPRAVYANLGNLTDVTDFQYRPTVDASPVTRDVFYGGTWHTLLAGGVGVGGRGVYALNITDPDPATFSASNVLWEFDADMTMSSGCFASFGSCRSTDLGYTVSQPNIGRVAYGNKWVVLVPNGYFPDCSKPDMPTADQASCQAIADQAPKDASGNPYSALFVLDAQTGNVIAELKTPTISGVTSFGLATPVMGDYNNDQIDDVAFAGDMQGNLWRFDLQSTTLSNWTVTLVYKGLADANGNQGLQPITTMPRLFPDPATNRFMVVFGTGKYLGAGDNSSNAWQAIYGIRDVDIANGPQYSQGDLTQQYLHETTIPAGATLPDGSPDPNAGATLRCVSGIPDDTCNAASATPTNPIPAVGDSHGGGWFINLCTSTGGACGAAGATQTNSGERVVVNPGAIFASNTVVFETLLAGAAGSDPCNPATQGALMAFNAVTGAPAGVSSLGGWPIVGGRISNARTSGSLPLVSALGGGQAYLPGTTLAPSGTKPLSIDAPIWRRRSWQGIQQN